MQSVPDVSSVLIEVGIKVVKANPKITTGYVVGVLVCVFATGFAPSQEAEANMDRAHNYVRDKIEPEMREKDAILRRAEHEYYNSKGWFSCDRRCQTHKAGYERALADFNVIKAQRDHAVASANAHVGIFSVYGVAEVRQLFWRMFQGGKDFAKRQTMWDALFVGIGSMARDESIVEYGMRLMLNMLFNFTIGLFGALVGFLWNLYGVVQSFGASLLTGGAFFALAALGGIAFVASWLVGLYAAAAGTLYVVGKSAANNARLNGGGRPNPGIRYQRRPQHQHYQ